MKKFSVIIMLLINIFVGCTTLLQQDQIDALAAYQKDTYILKGDLILRDEVVIKKDTKINIIMASTSEYAKVYAVKADVDPLKTERFLLLYMFEDDFKDKIYSKEEFEKKFYELVSVYKPPATAGKSAGTKTK